MECVEIKYLLFKNLVSTLNNLGRAEVDYKIIVCTNIQKFNARHIFPVNLSYGTKTMFPRGLPPYSHRDPEET